MPLGDRSLDSGAPPGVGLRPITQNRITRILALGFAAVIALLIAVGFIGVNGVKLIQDSAAELVQNDLITTRLINELQREQETLNAVLYKLTKSPQDEDRDRLLSQLDQADEAVNRIVGASSGLPEAALWKKLNVATHAFSSEARHLLALRNVSNYSSRQLFRLHEKVTALVAELNVAGYGHALESQVLLEQRSRSLLRESLIPLAGCFVLALLFAFFTVRTTTSLIRGMEWQAGELSRVSWHLLENQETTARRFSHELHDELGQSLTAVKANLQALRSQTSTDPARIDDCSLLVDEALGNVRELSHLLRPTILDDFGLDASIRWLAGRFTERTGIEVQYDSSFTERLPDETETHVFRIVQEALTNVARHSGATRVTIALGRAGDRLHLLLRDNGQGLPNGKGRTPGGGMGLTGMRARARGVGGELTVASPAGSGVSIELWAPLRVASGAGRE